MAKILSILLLCSLVLGCSAKQTDTTPARVSSEAGLRDSQQNLLSDPGQDQASYRRYAIMGFPRFPAVSEEQLDIVVLKNVGYVCGFSKKLQIPMWTCYRLGEEKLEYERSGEWSADPRLADIPLDEDSYVGSGKQRGHMAPAYGMMTRYGTIAMIESFSMANACPMEPRLNQGIWATSENHVARNKRRWANSKTEVWVVCGPLFEPDLPILADGVAVPRHFFKVLIRDPLNQKFDPEQAQSLAFLFPAEGAGEDQTLEDFIVPIDRIEASGIDIMPLLDARLEEKLERNSAEKRWGTAVWESE